MQQTKQTQIAPAQTGTIAQLNTQGHSFLKPCKLDGIIAIEDTLSAAIRAFYKKFEWSVMMIGWPCRSAEEWIQMWLIPTGAWNADCVAPSASS